MSLLAILKCERWWIAANLLGVGGFLYLASRTWLPPELRNYPDINSAISWGLTALPVAGLFLVVDAFWLASGIRQGAKSKRWAPLSICGVIGIVWMAALLLDRANH
jgi:hypothetical protein